MKKHTLVLSLPTSRIGSSKLPLFRVVVSNNFDMFTPNLVEDEPILTSHNFQRGLVKNHPTDFFIYSKLENHPAVENLGHLRKKATQRDFSCNWKPRWRASFNVLPPGFSVSDFYFPPDEWIPLVRSVCVFSWGCVKLHFCWGICFGRLLWKMCVCVFWKDCV